jgi:large subunit ribosomal protein L23
VLHNNAYTFLVHPKANKTEIRQAVERIWNVRVSKGNTANRKGKTKRFRFTEGKRADSKRAVVTLVEGYKIEHNEIERASKEAISIEGSSGNAVLGNELMDNGGGVRIGVTDSGVADVRDQLRGALAGPARLLLLDNLEQLPALGVEVAALLEACPSLTVLATSRSPLRLRAEHEFQLRPLSLPSLASGREAGTAGDGQQADGDAVRLLLIG